MILRCISVLKSIKSDGVLLFSQICLTDQTTDREYEFWHNKWVAVKDDDDGWTEIPLQQHDDIMLPSMCQHVINIYSENPLIRTSFI